MKIVTIVTAILACSLPLNAEDASKPDYFIAPDGAEYAHAGAIHISKERIRALPELSFPESPLPNTPQDAVTRAFNNFAERFPKAKKPKFVECSLKQFPQEIAKDRYYYQITLLPDQVEEETWDGSILIVGRSYVVVVPAGGGYMCTPALTVKPKKG